MIFFFAHPYAAWERGLNENTNGLIRQYFPKYRCFATITEEEIHELEENYRGMEKALAENDFSVYLELNAKCHQILTKYCENPILTNIVLKLKERLYNFPKIIVNIPEWEKMMMSDHDQMIQLLKKRDRDGLEDLIKNVHWNFKRNYPYILKYYEIFNLNESSEDESSGKLLVVPNE